MQVVYPRCAGIDVAKKVIAVCVRTPGEAPGERRSQVRKFKTYYGVLKEMCGWLTECGVTHVAMESTGIYSNPGAARAGGVREFRGDQVQCRAHQERAGTQNRRRRLCLDRRVAGVRAAARIVYPARQIAELRDLARYRTKLVGSRSSEIQRLQKTLEDAGIKLDSVASDRDGHVLTRHDRGPDRRGAPRRRCWPTWPAAPCGRKIPDLSHGTGRAGSTTTTP